MSLPTYANYYNKAGERIAAVFVNVGWWLTAETFADVVCELPWIKPAKTIELYGIKIPSDIMIPPEEVEFEDWKAHIIENSNTLVQEWERRNLDLKEKMKQIFTEHQEKQKESEKEETHKVQLPEEKKIILNSSVFGTK